MARPAPAPRRVGARRTPGIAPARPGRPSSSPPDRSVSREDQLLHRLIERQVCRTPRAVAVEHGPARITFEQLDELGNRLANVLRFHGVARERPVVVALDPSIELLICLYGTLKAGGCYVPLAPDLPDARLVNVLTEVRPCVVLTASPRVSCAARDTGDITVLTPAAARGGPDEPIAPRRPDVGAMHPEQLAYIISTSGSTGSPKGVMVPHRGITNTLRWRQRQYPFDRRDRVLLSFSYMFDASIFEIFQPLLSGARVVIPDRPLGGDPDHTVGTIRRHGITVLGVVPSLLRPLVEHPDFERCHTLRLVFCGGETLSPALVDAFRARSGAELVNVYGPTEASLEATAWSSRSPLPLSIGTPIEGAEAYVLDEHLAQRPPGVSGELFLSGAGIARGYLSDPRLTAERFLPDPYSATSGARMYRTGDRGQWLPAGGLQFDGRVDRQVKVRGQRIELGEIEAALLSHPGVRDACVIHEDPAGDGGRLIAYVATDPAQTLTRGALRDHLAARLATGMLPNEVVLLDALPRTAAGKVDRPSLSAPSPRARHGEPETGTTTGPLEDLVRTIWCRVLGATSVGDDDDFFELGGTSVQAAILAHSLEDALGEFVYPVAVYDAPTVSQLSAYLRVHYPDAVARLTGAVDVTQREDGGADVAAIRRLDAAVRRSESSSLVPAPAERLDPAVFVLAPPRSGSTLLRVILGGHSALFAPPELQLLNFVTLRERRDALASDRDSFWLQGSVRALMELLGCGPDRAEQLMADFVRQDMSVHNFYGFLQRLAGGRMLVDKTPTYALDAATLRRAEATFREPRYVHLVRDPRPAIASFEEAKLDVFFPPFFRHDPGLSTRQLAEAVWTLSHTNIGDFLQTVPALRQCTVRFEDLVADPDATVARITDFLGLAFEPAMTRPYEHDQRRLMTDPVRPLGRMLGDVKYHQHGRIRAHDPRRDRRPTPRIAEPTASLATRFGYVVAPVGRNLLTLQPLGSPPGVFCVHPAVGTATCYAALAAALGDDIPLHGLRNDGRPVPGGPATVEELAAAYLEQVLAAQADGPYHLIGWSFGGLVAVEMALQLRAAGRAGGAVVLFASHLPPITERPLPSSRRFILRALQERFAERPDASARRVRSLEEAFTVARQVGVVAATESYDAFLTVIDELERTYRHHVTMARAYRPAARLAHLVLFEPVDTSLDDRGPFPDWTTVADRVDRLVTPGNHFSVLSVPHVDAVASRLRPLLRPGT
jgi:amino acid adenylation domain-containing protein